MLGFSFLHFDTIIIIIIICKVGDISELEKVQRRAARWVLNDYGRFSSVSSMLDQLKWPTLQVRRKLSRLQILHKIHYQQLSLQIPHYYLPKT